MNKQKVQKILSILGGLYPGSGTALNFQTPHQMLVATILSAQCTDARVNMVTPGLFERYPDVESFAEAEQSELEQIIRSTGFYRNKAKNIIGASKMIVEKYGGEVPANMNDLLCLPGVARKTANVVLQNAFGIVEGVVVDTHVGRLAVRLGLSKEKTAEKIEMDLMKLVPKDKWADLSYLLIDHGRAVCKARKPDCAGCTLNRICPSAFNLN